MNIGSNLSKSEYHLLIGAPRDYPVDQPVAGEHLMPVLVGARREDIPSDLAAFNDVGRGTIPSQTGIHFFKSDAKIAHVLGRPKKYGNTLGHFKVLLTPDVTLSDGMPEWMRAKNTFLSRAAGAAWEAQGITVIPTLRWISPGDYDLICSGLPSGGVFAVSSYGSIRDRVLRNIFIDGLAELAKRLQPVAILVYGTALKEIQEIVGPNIEVVMYPTPTQKLRLAQTSIKDDQASRLF
jgi:hypothetical protein